jgi:hypothetical protein
MVTDARRALGLGVLLAWLAGCGSHQGAQSSEDDAAVDDAAVDETADDPDAEDTPASDASDEGPLDAGREGGSSQRDASASDSGAPGGGDAATSAPDVDRKNPQLYELALDPHVLDPSTVDSLSTQYAQLDTRTAPLGQLVVFLPGANNVPRDWRDHGRKLAEYGFHVLIPHYNNRWSSDDTCTGQGNSCADDTRWEALTGENSSAAVAIARADSAEGRVVTMLKHLITANAAGDWGYYLTADSALLYGKIIIAGISHGAASAGMYAARRPFARNVMHSSGPAGSPTASKMTPLSAWYGFAHTADDAYSAITTAWERFALPGQVVNIDGQAAPFNDSHRLATSAMSSYPHGSVAVHSSSPKDASGKYLFEAAWRYLYGVPAR